MFSGYAYDALACLDRAAADRLAKEAQRDIDVRWRLYEQLAAVQLP